MQVIEKLSPREQQCLLLAAQDKRMRETAIQMMISVEGVKKHRKMILQKLHCQTITGALSYAFRNRLIEL